MKKNHLSLLIILTCSIGLLSFAYTSNAPLPPENEKDNFKEFIQSFPHSELPYQIEVEDLEDINQQADHEQKISEDQLMPDKYAVYIPGLLNAQFSRTPPDHYKFEAKLYENEAFVVVSYSVLPSFPTPTYQPTKYYLATFDKTNKDMQPNKRLISEITLAQKNRYIKIGTVQSDLSIATKTYKKKLKNGIYELADEPFETITYQISKKGMIKKSITDLAPEVQKKKHADLDH